MRKCLVVSTELSELVVETTKKRRWNDENEINILVDVFLKFLDGYIDSFCGG